MDLKVNTVIKSRDVIFDEMWFSSIPEYKDMISNNNEGPNSGNIEYVTSRGPYELNEKVRETQK